MPHGLNKKRSALSRRTGPSVGNILAVIIVFLVFNCPVLSGQSSATGKVKQGDARVAVTQKASEARELEPGKSFEKQINSGETRYVYLGIGYSFR